MFSQWHNYLFVKCYESQKQLFHEVLPIIYVHCLNLYWINILIFLEFLRNTSDIIKKILRLHTININDACTAHQLLQGYRLRGWYSPPQLELCSLLKCHEMVMTAWNVEQILCKICSPSLLDLQRICFTFQAVMTIS